MPGGQCPGPGDSGEQARHSPLANLLGCSRRCRPGAAAGLGLLSEEKQGPALCPQGRSQQVASWSLRVKGSTSGAGEQEAFCICLVICWKKHPWFLLRGCFYINNKPPAIQHVTRPLCGLPTPPIISVIRVHGARCSHPSTPANLFSWCCRWKRQSGGADGEKHGPVLGCPPSTVQWSPCCCCTAPLGPSVRAIGSRPFINHPCIYLT